MPLAIPVSRYSSWSASVSKGVLTGLKLVEHKEPIVLLGIPRSGVVEAVNKLIGADMDRRRTRRIRRPQVDIVSGATVTVLVMGTALLAPRPN